MASREYIPKGTRFGPLVGQIYTADSVPKDANRKYFWRVSGFPSCPLTHTHTKRASAPLSVKDSHRGRKTTIGHFLFH